MVEKEEPLLKEKKKKSMSSSNDILINLKIRFNWNVINEPQKSSSTLVQIGARIIYTKK